MVKKLKPLLPMLKVYYLLGVALFDHLMGLRLCVGHRYQKTYVSIWSPVVVGLTGLAVVLLILNIGLGIYRKLD